jgi:hypothetical protein
MRAFGAFRVLLAACVCLPLLGGPAHADLDDCEGLRVHWINVRSSTGLNAIIFRDPNTGEDSQWVWTNDTSLWTVDERQDALSVALSAKLSGMNVQVMTHDATQCNIRTSGQKLRNIIMK